MSSSKILLVFLILAFIGGGGYLTLLSQGIVFDYENFRFVKTGGLFLSYTPMEAKLELNGEAIKASYSFFSNGAFITNLIPNEYHLRLTAENFRPYEKNITVEPGLVTELQKIILIPEKIEAEKIIDRPIENFWLTEAGVIYKKNGSLFLEKQILRGKNIILNSPDYSLVVTENSGNYFLINLIGREADINLTALFNSLKQRQLALPGTVPIRKIFFHPFNPVRFIIFTQKGLYELDSRRVTLEQLVLFENEIVAENIDGNEISAVDNKGNLLTINLLIKNRDLKNGWLEDFNNFQFSADGKNIFVLRSNGKIDVLDLKKNKQWRLEIEKADSFSVLKEVGSYLLIKNGDRLFISETQNGNPTNHYLLANNVKKYEVKDKEIYFLRNNGELMKITL